MADEAELAAALDWMRQQCSYPCGPYDNGGGPCECDRLIAALRRPAPPPAHKQLLNLADALTEDILDTPDADLLAEEAPPAHAELAGRLRSLAKLFPFFGTNVGALLTEAANALEGT